MFAFCVICSFICYLLLCQCSRVFLSSCTLPPYPTLTAFWHIIPYFFTQPPEHYPPTLPLQIIDILSPTCCLPSPPCTLTHYPTFAPYLHTIPLLSPICCLPSLIYITPLLHLQLTDILSPTCLLPSLLHITPLFYNYSSTSPHSYTCSLLTYYPFLAVYWHTIPYMLLTDIISPTCSLLTYYHLLAAYWHTITY